MSASRGTWTAHYGWATECRTEPTPEHPEWVEVAGTRPDGSRMSLTGHAGIDVARIAASAPTMLDLLERTVAVIERAAPTPSSDAWLVEARAAIALARTGAPA